MTAVTSAQTPPTDLLLSLLTGMVGSPAVDGLAGTTGKPGEFAGLLESLEGDPLAAKEQLNVELPETERQSDGGELGNGGETAGNSQLTSLMTASLTRAGSPSNSLSAFTSQTQDLRGGGVEGADRTVSGNPPTAAAKALPPAVSDSITRKPQFHSPEQPLAPSPAGWSPRSLPAVPLDSPIGREGVKGSSPQAERSQRSGSGLAGLPQSAGGANSTPSAKFAELTPLVEPSAGPPAPAENLNPNTPELGSFAPLTFNQAVGGPAGSAIESGERVTRGAAARESRRSGGDGSWQWDLNATGSALPQTATAVTAIAASTNSRQEGIQASLPDVIETREPETFHRRLELTSADNIGLATQEPTELVELQAQFESHLEQLSEAFPLDSVAAQIATAAEPDAGWITVEIQPPELGKLEIMVSKQGDDYLARIVAHEAATGDALSLQREQLIDALGQHGLELKEVQISSESNSGDNWKQSNAQAESDQGREQQRSHEEHSWSGSNAPASVQSTPTRGAPHGEGGAGSKQVNLLV